MLRKARSDMTDRTHARALREGGPGTAKAAGLIISAADEKAIRADLAEMRRSLDRNERNLAEILRRLEARGAST